MPLSAQGVQNVKSVLNDATSQGKSGAPGLVFIAVDRSGKTLVEHAAGTKSVNSPEPVDLDTTFWIASMTKIVTTIAVLQLVEQKKLALDDPEDVKKYAPEIGKKLVYADGVHGVEQQRDVTLRMLLAHTAGFAYSFIDPRVGLNTAPVGTDEFSGDWEEILESPLVNQPGSMWEYSISLDWAGIILERATGVKLNEYFQQHVFEPLGVEDVTMFPGSDMRGKLAHMHQRDGEGNLEERDHLYRRVFNIRSEEARDRIFHSGGGGLFAKPKEYASESDLFRHSSCLELS
jgi:CubicO group peptidase (beta-lactamase class C family)